MNRIERLMACLLTVCFMLLASSIARAGNPTVQYFDDPSIDALIYEVTGGPISAGSIIVRGAGEWWDGYVAENTILDAFGSLSGDRADVILTWGTNATLPDPFIFALGYGPNYRPTGVQPAATQLLVYRNAQGITQDVIDWPHPIVSCTLSAADDPDGDCIAAAVDRCLDVPNRFQVDTDGDGYGNRCDGDFNQTGTVNVSDFNIFSICFNAAQQNGGAPTGTAGGIDCRHTDMNGNGVISVSDYNVWFSLYPSGTGIPGPSCCAP